MSAIRALTNNIFRKPNYRICAFTISNNLKSGKLFPLWGPSTTAIRTYAEEGKDKKREKGNLFIMEYNPTKGTSTFEEVLGSDTFVDKSALILAVLETDEKPMVLCTAPRRFGKTANLWMMQHFLEMEVDKNGEEKTTVLEEKYNYKLFSSARLKVMQNKEFVKTHFGQYPILEINLFCCGRVKSESDAVDVCRGAISRAFRQHSYLYESKLSPLENDEKKDCEKWCDESTYEGIPDKNVMLGLATLALYLNKFHKKQVFLLVDDYDSIIRNALQHVKNTELELEKAASIPIRLIGHALKTFPEIFKGAYITGEVDVGGVANSTLWGSNVLRCQFGTNNLCRDFNGFTEEEVCTLFNRFEVKEELRRKAENKYNGYFIGSKKRLYSPQSIVRFLGNLSLGENALQNYWLRSPYIHHMYQLFQEDSVRMLLSKLLLQGVIDFEITLRPLELSDLKSLRNILINGNLTCDIEIVVRFLVSLGYLTYSSDDQKLQIPNSELIDEFIEELKRHFGKIIGTYGINSRLERTCSKSFSKLTFLCDEGDSSKFKEELANLQNSLTCLLQRSTLIDPLDEATLQTIITLACNRCGLLFDSTMRIVNYGTKVDVMLYNVKYGIIMELKCDPYTVEDAFKQVFKNHYCNVFPTPKILDACQNDAPLSLLMGIHVDSEQKASVMCLQRKDIIDVLDDLKIDAEPLLENRIKMAVERKGERFINICCKKAKQLHIRETKSCGLVFVWIQSIWLYIYSKFS